jgi:DNA mismatch endonuclease (patch repair protein)
MPDNLTPAERSIRMRAVRQKGTQPELTLRRGLHKLGLRYRINVRTLFGSPDLVFARYKVAIFVNGCFWHRHARCKKTTTPKSNVDFWEKKFSDNVNRDLRNTAMLESSGWRVLTIWQCELENSVVDSTIERCVKFIKPH